MYIYRPVPFDPGADGSPFLEHALRAHPEWLPHLSVTEVREGECVLSRDVRFDFPSPVGPDNSVYAQVGVGELTVGCGVWHTHLSLSTIDGELPAGAADEAGFDAALKCLESLLDDRKVVVFMFRAGEYVVSFTSVPDRLEEQVASNTDTRRSVDAKFHPELATASIQFQVRSFRGTHDRTISP